MIKLKILLYEVMGIITSEYWIINNGDIIYAERQSGDGSGHDDAVIKYLRNFLKNKLKIGIESEISVEDIKLVFPNKNDEEIETIFMIVNYKSDISMARDYGLYNLGWIRVSGNNFQCAKITSKEIVNIIKGIEKISKTRQFSGDVDDLILNIEVLNAKSIYVNVPYRELRTIKNVTELGEYRRKYEYMREECLGFNFQ